MFKFNNKNARKRYEICSKLTIKTLKQRQWSRSGVCIVDTTFSTHICKCLPRTDIYNNVTNDYLIDKNEKFQCVSNPTHLLISRAYTFNAKRTKMVRNTLNILHQILQDFQSLSDCFGRSFPKRNCRRIAWVCLTILWGWHLKD